MKRLEAGILASNPVSLDQHLRESDDRSYQLVDTIADLTTSDDSHQLDLEAAVDILRSIPGLADELALLELSAIEGAVSIGGLVVAPLSLASAGCQSMQRNPPATPPVLMDWLNGSAGPH